MDECSENFFMEIKEEEVDDDDVDCGEVIFSRSLLMLNFKCNVCDFTFTSYKTFIKHTIKHILDTNDDLLEEIIDNSLKEIPDEDFIQQKSESSDITCNEKKYNVLEQDGNEQNLDNNWVDYEKCDMKDLIIIPGLPTEEESQMSGTAKEDSEEDYTDIYNLGDFEGTEDNDDAQDSCVVDFNIEVCADNDNVKQTFENVEEKHDVNSNRRCVRRDTPLICKECNKEFPTRYNLGRHMQLHQASKPYACEFCDATFKDYGNFSVHRNRHLGIQPHACKECGKRFTTTTDLKAHMRKHSDVRPYVCDVCGVTYKAKQELIRHIDRQHSNKRPFSCDQCNKSFYDKRTLNDHRISHSGVRAFSCKICQKNFSRKKSLAEHMKLHSNEYKHSCPYCVKKFQQRPGLISHLRNYHKK